MYTWERSPWHRAAQQHVHIFPLHLQCHLCNVLSALVLSSCWGWILFPYGRRVDLGMLKGWVSCDAYEGNKSGCDPFSAFPDADPISKSVS